MPSSLLADGNAILQDGGASRLFRFNNNAGTGTLLADCVWQDVGVGGEWSTAYDRQLFKKLMCFKDALSAVQRTFSV